MNDDVAILGTGAMACLIGAALQRAGSRVTLLGRWHAGVEAITRAGVCVEEEGGAWRVSARALDLASAHPQPSPRVLVLVKGHQTGTVVPDLQKAVAPGGSILTLQNGWGPAAILAEACPRAQLSVGLAYIGATLMAPGVVRHAGGRRIVIDRAGESAWVATLARAGFDLDAVDDIQPHVWAKLAVNCAINPLTALHGVANGVVVERPELREQLVAAATEVGRVAQALQVALPSGAAGLALAAARLTAANRSSMLQDLDAGRLTEIEVLNGAVLREGRRLGLGLPVIERLYDEIVARERQMGLREGGQ